MIPSVVKNGRAVQVKSSEQNRTHGLKDGRTQFQCTPLQRESAKHWRFRRGDLNFCICNPPGRVARANTYTTSTCWKDTEVGVVNDNGMQTSRTTISNRGNRPVSSHCYEPDSNRPTAVPHTHDIPRPTGCSQQNWFRGWNEGEVGSGVDWRWGEGGGRGCCLALRWWQRCGMRAWQSGHLFTATPPPSFPKLYN